LCRRSSSTCSGRPCSHSHHGNESAQVAWALASRCSRTVRSVVAHGWQRGHLPVRHHHACPHAGATGHREGCYVRTRTAGGREPSRRTDRREHGAAVRRFSIAPVVHLGRISLTVSTSGIQLNARPADRRTAAGARGLTRSRRGFIAIRGASLAGSRTSKERPARAGRQYRARRLTSSLLNLALRDSDSIAERSWRPSDTYGPYLRAEAARPSAGATDASPRQCWAI
jgi:hypothetical protein